MRISTFQGNLIATVPASGSTWFGATLPTLPVQFSTTSSPPTPANTNRGSYYTPGVGGDAGLTLQAALNSAAAAAGTKGDVIQLLSGSANTQTTASSFTLPVRVGSGTIYIITNTAPEIGGIGLPAAGTRVAPANIPAMASLRCSGTGGPVINRANGVGVTQYRLVGLDLQLVQGNANSYVVQFNNLDTTTATLAQNITLDRCYVAGAPISGVQHAIGMDGINIEVTECYVERCWFQGIADVNCTVAINSIGPYKVHNCYLEAQGQGTFFGGADTTLPQPNMPSDITITNNYYYKNAFSAQGTVTNGSTTLTITSVSSGIIQPAMDVLALSGFIPANVQIIQQLSGTTGGIGTYQLSQSATGTSSAAETMTGTPFGKNAVEFKVGQRVLFDSNYLENAGTDVARGQPREAFVLTCRNQSGANPWYALLDFTITNNVFTNCPVGGFNLLLQDNLQVTQPGNRILFRNNLFLLSSNGNNTASWSMGFIISSTTGATPGGGSNVVFDHNTFIATTPSGQNSFLGMGGGAAMALFNVVWSNNIWDHNQFGIINIGSPSNYASSVPPQVTQPAYINNVNTGGNGGPFPPGNFVAASSAAVGYVAYGSNTLTAGYALTSSSAYHGAGVSGLNQVYTSTGTADGTDIGCNVAALPSKQFSPPPLLTMAQAGYIIVANAATLTAAGISVGPLGTGNNTQRNSYNVDPTGIADSTAGIQHAINDGCLDYQPVYLPNQTSGAQGIYKITNTLEFYTFANQFDTAYSQTSGHHFLAATNAQGQNPILRASNANGNFTNLLGSGLARPVVMVTAFSAGTTLPPVSPTNFNMGFDPYTFPSGWGNGTADVVSHSFINLNIDTGGLANAGGTSIVGAQTVWVANLQVNATGSVYGIGVLPGNGSVVMNAKITGGQYGINSFMTYALSNWESDTPTVAGLTCIGQTKACVTAGGTASPILIVGADLEPATGGVAYDPVNPSDSFNVNHSAMFYNVKVVGPGDAASTAFKNVGGYNLYLGDVWVSGFTNVTQFAGLAPQVCGGPWTHVTEYVATNQYKGNTIHTGTAQPPWSSVNWVNNVVTFGNAGDGALNNQPATSILTSAGTPPTNLVSRHVVNLALIDTTPFIDIRSAPYNAQPLSVSGQLEGSPTHNRGTYTFNFSNDSASTPDNVTAINNAITAAPPGTAVLIPLGVWETSGPLNLGANTILMGLGDYRSWISTHKNWVPVGPAPGTAVLTTVSNPSTTTALVNVGLNMRRNAGTGTYTANGGTGQNNDFFIPYIWQCGGQCFTFGNQHHYQFITTPVTTFALQYRQFQGANAGGRFYGGDTPDSQIGLGCNTAARALMVNGSTQPMYFYGLNLENSKNNGVSMTYNMEITGASNVRVYGTKREGNGNTYSITQNCNNVGLFGSSFIRIGSPANATFIGATGNQNILVHAHTAFSDTTSTTQFILSDAGSGFNLDSPKILSVYKNGNLNDAAMVIGGGAQIFNFPTFNATNTLSTTSATASGNLVILGNQSGLAGSNINIFLGGGHSGGKAWYGNQVDVHNGFTTDFVMTPPQPGQMTFTAPNTTDGAIGITFCVQTSNSTTDPSPTPTYGVQAGGDANLAGYGAFWWGGNPGGTSPMQSAIRNSIGICFHMESQNSIQWVPLSSGAQANPNSIAFLAAEGQSDSMQPCQDLNPSGISFYNGHPIAVHIVYDGSLITITMLDTVNNNQFRTSWPFVVQRMIGGNSGWVGFAGGKAEKPNLVSTAACTWLINSWSFSQGFNTRLASPTFSLPAGQYGSTQNVSLSAPAGSTIYYSVNGQQPTTSSTQYNGPVSISSNTYLQAVAVQSGFTDSLVASANYLIQAPGPTINFPTTFAGAGNLLSLVGTASIQGAAVQLILAQASQPIISGYVGCAWYVAPVTVSGSWSTTFTFQYPTGGSNNAAGLTFCIQNLPLATDFAPVTLPGAAAVWNDGQLRWSAGGPLAMGPGTGFGYSGPNSQSGTAPGGPQYTGLTRSVAIKFDAGNNTTSVYQGPPPGTAVFGGPNIQVGSGGTATGLTFISGNNDKFQVNVTYDGTNLSWTIKNLRTSTVFSSGNQAVNITNAVGGTTAYVGFTAGSFFGTQIEILSWTGF